MSTKAVNTSLALILLMLLSSLSYSVLNDKEEKSQFNDQATMMTSTTASNYTPLVLQTQYFEQDENPGYIGTTYDDRIIVYSEAQDARGDFSNSISIYSYPDTGHNSQTGTIEIPQMTLDREISLPSNFSEMRVCTPILHPDDYISLACSRAQQDANGFGIADTLRLDFDGFNHTIYDNAGSIFVWDDNDVLDNFIQLNGSGTSTTSNLKPSFNGEALVKKSNNFTYYGKSEIGNYLELNGINYQCPASFTGTCTALYEFDRNGTILSIIFSEQISNYNSYCPLDIRDITDDGYIELYAYKCEFRLGDDTYLFSTSTSFDGQNSGYLILDSIFSYVMNIQETNRCHSGGNMNVRIKEIEMTHQGLFYMAHTTSDCSQLNYWPFSVSTNLHGNNIVGLAGKNIISVGLLNISATDFNSPNDLDWVYTWSYTGSTNFQGLSEQMKYFDSDKLFWEASWTYQHSTIDWDSEIGGRTSPDFIPSNTGPGNSVSLVLSSSGIWLQTIPKVELIYGSTTKFGCSYDDVRLQFETTSNGLSCFQQRPDMRDYPHTFFLFNTDSDGDAFADQLDKFPLEDTQNYDTDLDGFGDNQLGFEPDACITQAGNSTIDRFGCSDLDGDGMSDLTDAFVLDASQTTDSDNDGYGDNLTGFRGDACPNDYGESNRNGTFGCVDYDFDGWADLEDVFPYDSSQWSDWDGDGFGDELIGYEGDACPSQYGNSTNDRYGCVDDDGDGWSNAGDDFTSNPTQYSDVDGDGYGDNQSVGATMSDAFPNDGTQWNDTDGDGYGDNPYGNQGDKFPNDPTKWQDSDDDGYADEDDAFVNDATQWNDTDGDGYGDEANGNRPDAFPNDPLEWQDSDGDGYGNNADAFPVDGTQWNDTDGDGYGDNPYGTQGDWFPNDPNRWQDSDRDGYADEDDAFPNDITQWNDTDGDGYGDNQNGNNGDDFPNDSTEWKDSDEDGVGNNADQYPYDPTQTVDSDGDGYGDNTNGTRGDAFPQDDSEWSDIDSDGYGDNSDLFPSDGTQWNDTDGDGYGDNINGNRGDVFPQDDTEWSDIDNDGYGDNSDLFLTDGTQWNDTDGDGFGDNLNGANGDACPLISGNSSIILLGCVDTDGDGYADQIDAFISDALSWSDVDGDTIPDELDAYPNDATQSLDSDGDGFGDNPLGTNADKFPNDATQWNDIDGDGYGDNLDGNNPDLFITDGTQWADSDGDGYGDNPQGRLYDMFPDNPTQWLDEDGDGLGDNQSGTDADPFLNDFDNDGFNDAIDILPKLSSPGDLDADGCLDEVDAFPENPQECVDTDNDGVGDNADSDDDDDGWTDADEIRLNADPLSASNQPVDSFEIVVPGTSIGLSAWDLIGIFGGIPLFAWLAFGFATRNGRCQKYEDLLNQATSRDELEQVALRWEYSLMLRMLGPHQGIRLERLRAELDDRFENSEPENIGVNQTSIVEQEAKELPPIEAKTESIPSKDTPADSTDDEGYEWLKDESGIDWYRAAESGDEWAKFES